VDAAVNVPDGTPIRFASSRGEFTSASSTVINGQANASLQVESSQTSSGMVVITAAVAKSLAKASVPFAPIIAAARSSALTDNSTEEEEEDSPSEETFAQAITGLVETMKPCNGGLTPDEKTELTQSYTQAFQQAQANGFATGLLKLFPLEGGGDLENQAAHGNWRLKLAGFLDAQTAIIKQAAEAAAQIHVAVEAKDGTQRTWNMNTGQIQVLDNGNGLLMETDFATEFMNAYCFQFLQSAVMLANTVTESSDVNGTMKLAKRMGAHLMGLAVSAAMGSETAKHELSEMCPLYSWYLIGEDTKTLWDAGDYYGAGTKAFDLSLNVVADVTIFVPVAKAVAIGVRLAEPLTARVVQVTRKVAADLASDFTRTTEGRMTHVVEFEGMEV
jgi:hypothetical protein